MPSTVLTLVNGVPRSVSAPVYVPIYETSLQLVSGSPGAGQITGPIVAGTNITLPSGQQYNSTDLTVFLNGDRMEAVYDYNYVGTVPRTQIQMTFNLVVGDLLVFRVDRSF